MNKEQLAKQLNTGEYLIWQANKIKEMEAMKESDQSIVDEGALLICLLVTMVTELDDRPRNEDDDEIIESAMNWVEECTDVVHILSMTEH